MAFVNTFKFAPAAFLPFQDREVLDRVVNQDIRQHQGNNFENPDLS